MRPSWVRTLGRRIVLLVVCALSATASASATYVFTPLPPLAGGQSAIPFGLNNSGQVVGITDFPAPCFGCGGYSRATLWNGTTASDLGGVGTSNYAHAINDAGQVAGWSHFAYNSHTAAVRWTAGVPTDLVSMGGLSGAYGINSLGQVAGWAMTSSTTASATVWSHPWSATYLGADSEAMDVNDAGQVAGNLDGAMRWDGLTAVRLNGIAGYAKAEAINSKGQVVGWSTAPGGQQRATLWNSPEPIDLGSLGGHSYAHGINDLGHVVGEARTAVGSVRAFLWKGTGLLDLNDLIESSVADQWELIDAYDINERGQIVGRARNNVIGQISGYLLTPKAIFGDVPFGHWAEQHIRALYERVPPITTGCLAAPLLYCPDAVVTREQMAAFVIRALEGEPSPAVCDGGSGFADVPSASPFCKYIHRMAARGITLGCGDGAFCPTQEVTREQMAAFLVRAIEGDPPDSTCSNGSGFSDVSAASAFCKYVRRLAETGITVGCGGGQFCPTVPVSRDQMAVFIARAFLATH